MSKTKTPLTVREEIEKTLKTLNSQTRVKAWVFSCKGKFYKIIQCFYPRKGNVIEAYECDKKGMTTNRAPIFSLPGTDYTLGVEKLTQQLEQRFETSES
jgi:predicted DNA-binding protein with PD1-like motif